MEVTLNEIRFNELLDHRQVAVVHFSHHGIMGHHVEFPLDLQHALANYDTETRSCCALFPGHRMNLPGSVGVIFKPTRSQVLSVCRCDSGSSDIGGIEGSLGNEPTEDAILESLNIADGNYNEWRIRGSMPIGIFVANPFNVMAKKIQTLTCGDEVISEIGCMTIMLDDVFEAFPSLPIFTMGLNGLEVLRKPDGA